MHDHIHSTACPTLTGGYIKSGSIIRLGTTLRLFLPKVTKVVMTVLIKIFFLLGAALLTSAGPLTEKSNEENDIAIVQHREKRQAG